MRKVGYLVFCLIVLPAAPLLSAGATQYKIHVLDTPPGQSYSAAHRINDQGVIAGVAAFEYSGRSQGGVYYWNTTGVHYAGFVLRKYGLVGLNNSGTIVGSRFVSSNSTLATLPTLLPTYGHNELADINDAGIIVGGSVYVDPYHYYHATLWDGAGIHDLGALEGDVESLASGVNDLGQAVGWSENPLGFRARRGVLWENGSKTQLDPLPGYDASSALRINNLGQVVGASSKWAIYYYAGSEHKYLREEAVLWWNGATVDVASEGLNTVGADINDLGQVVGYAYSYPDEHGHRPFLWEDGALTWLDGPGGDSIALGINENGWIVGRAFGTDRNWHAVVWEPIVPEPSSLLALAFALSGLGCVLVRRRHR